jgi:hypothetical protein
MNNPFVVFVAVPVAVAALVVGVALKSRNDARHVEAMHEQAAQQKRVADHLEAKEELEAQELRVNLNCSVKREVVWEEAPGYRLYDAGGIGLAREYFPGKGKRIEVSMNCIQQSKPREAVWTNY